MKKLPWKLICVNPFNSKALARHVRYSPFMSGFWTGEGVSPFSVFVSFFCQTGRNELLANIGISSVPFPPSFWVKFLFYLEPIAKTPLKVLSAPVEISKIFAGFRA